MVKLHFNARGHVFQQGIDSIEQAYKSTVQSLAQQIKHAQTQASFKPYAKENIGLPGHVVDRDEEHPSFDWVSMWAFIEENIWLSLAVAREAYLVILYHHWEKQCAEWIGAKYVEKDAFDWLRREGVKADESGITRLRRIANYIKHENPALMKDHPELVRNGSLVLSHEIVEELFSIIRESGLKPFPQQSSFE